MTPDIPQISEAESHVMDVLWRHGKAGAMSTEDVALALMGQQDWQLSTIKTLLGRLLNKGAVAASATSTVPCCKGKTG
jgi:BlaI family transcriptional regulator, penicillinase repressor